MQTIQNGYRGLRLIWKLNLDRLLYICTILFALCFGAFIGSL